MFDCPGCGDPLADDAVVCNGCKWTPTKAGKAPVRDPNWWRCCDTDMQGQRCAKAGSLSESTRGSDRWYCHQHYPPFRGRGYGLPRIAPPQGWKGNLALPPARSIAVMAEDLLERAALQSEDV